MASLLYLVAGAVAGFLAGWLLRSRRPAATPGTPVSPAPAGTATGSASDRTTGSAPDRTTGSAPARTTGSASDSTAAAGPAQPAAAGPAQPAAAGSAEPAVELVPVGAAPEHAGAKAVAEHAETPAETPEPLAAEESAPPTIPAQKTELNDPAPVTEMFSDPGPATELYGETTPAGEVRPAGAAEAPAPVKRAAPRRAAPRKTAARSVVEPEPISTTAAPTALTTPPAEPTPISTPIAEPTPVPTAVAEPTAVAGPAAVVIPAQANPAAVREPDDLTRIPGIGPKMAMALAAGGITTFEQLAATDIPALRATVTAAGMRLAPTLPTWPERAKLLAG